jgi:hypothetical protein
VLLYSKKALYILIIILIFNVIFSACASRDPQSKEETIKQAIERLRSGELIRAIETNQLRNISEVVHNAPSVDTPTSDVKPQSAIEDPCPDVPQLLVHPTDEAMDQLLVDFGGCLRQLGEPVVMSLGAIEYFKTYVVGPNEKSLSSMDFNELKTFLYANFLEPSELFGTGSSIMEKYRNSYSNDELDELARLVELRNQAFATLEAKVFLAASLRKELIDKYSYLTRYKVLRILMETANDSVGMDTAKKLMEALRGNMSVPKKLTDFPVELLHPFVVFFVIPSQGFEKTDLDPNFANPFMVSLVLLGELSGSVERARSIMSVYAEVRDRDNPALPEHPAPAQDAARVAFIDTGIDFLQYPDLTLFAGNGNFGQLSQGDYGDGDSNPWVPAFGLLGHGTGTMASLLTIMAHHAPETLSARQLDIAMWKVSSARSILTGPPYDDLARFDTRSSVGFVDAIFKRIQGDEVKPKIVSISAIFPTEKYLDRSSNPNMLKSAPWLWVMAAGNESQNVRDTKIACLEDVPLDRRPSERVLCVGALEKGIVFDRIAAYSNYGDRVDVYTYESYYGLCPNGTSCATPAVSAAAAIIAAKYPLLTPEQIKEVIVSAAEVRTLPVATSEQSLMQAVLDGFYRDQMTVKVFDPITMLPKALENAVTIAQRTADPITVRR